MNIRKRNGLASFLALCTLVLSACGGGSSSSSEPAPEPTLLTGYLIDSTVQGLSVRSGASVSTTAADGSFVYEEGAPTTFSLGGIVLGSSEAGPVVTLQDIAGSATGNRMANLQRFLQTLDEDGDADNGVSISTDVSTAAASMSLDFSLDEVAFEVDSRTQYAVSVLGALLSPARSTLLASGAVRPTPSGAPSVQWTSATNTRGWNGKIRVNVPGADPVELISVRYVLVGGRSEQCLVIVSNSIDPNVLVGKTVTVGSKSFPLRRAGIAGNGQVRYQSPASTAGCSLPQLATGGPYAVSVR